MRILFLTIQLEAVSVYELMVIWTNIKLIIDEDGKATLVGNGFAPDIVWAFNTLIPEWTATIHLSYAPVGLAPGIYPMNYLKEQFFVTRNQKKFVLTDQPALVEVVLVNGGE